MNSITKKCGKCNQIKNLEEFTVEPKREGGRHSICRKCKSEYDKKYKIENKEKIASRATDYWNKNKERIKKRFDNWYKANFEKVSKSNKKRAELNKDSIKVYQKKWRAENALHLKNYRKEYFDKNRDSLNEMMKINLHKKRAKKREVGGSFSVKQWRKLCDYYGNKCLKCGRNDLKLTIDHVLPTNLRGLNSISNLQPLCLSCNSSKQDTYMDYRFDGGEYARSLENE